MITFLEGRLVEMYPTHVVINVQGVGYQVQIPLSSYSQLPQPGNTITILTHLQVREDAHTLFGFVSQAERDLFRLLINHVSGIGPKTALDVLSGSSVASFRNAVASSDIKALSQIKGIGKKTAERIIVELKDKVGIPSDWATTPSSSPSLPADSSVTDAVLALMALGYRETDAMKAIRSFTETHLGESFAPDVLVREALKRLAH